MKKDKPKTTKPKKPVQQTGTKPFPVPPNGCPDGYYDNGSGMCVLDS